MKVHRSRRPAVIAALVATAATASAAHAQGFGLNEIGTCSVGRAGAGTAAPCKDASSLFWNPAAGAMQADSGAKRWSILAGAAAIGVNGSFTQDTTLRKHEGDVPVAVPPHLFAQWHGRLNRYHVNRIALGVGAYVPYGLTSQWADDFPGRFAAKKAGLQTVYIQPTVSLEIVPNRLSIGGGPVIGHSRIELVQSLDLAKQGTGATVNGQPVTFGNLGIPSGTEFARFSGHGDAWAGGFHLGLQAQVTPSLAVGARLLSALYFEYEGEGRFDQVLTGITLNANGPLTPGSTTPTSLDDFLRGRSFCGTDACRLQRQGINSNIKHPAQVQAGLAFTGIANTTLNVDYNFTKWSDFETLPINFEGQASASSREIIEDYSDSHSIRASVDHVFQGSSAAPFLNGVTGRLGFNYVKSPAPDLTVTPLLPDMDRYNFGIGAGIPLTDRVGLDLSYLRVETPGRRGRIVERDRSETDLTALNSGWYELTANIVSLSLKASF